MIKDSLQRFRQGLFEYSCGCCLSPDDIKKIIGTEPFKPGDWQSVTCTPARECGACGGSYRMMYRRELEIAAKC